MADTTLREVSAALAAATAREHLDTDAVWAAHHEAAASALESSSRLHRQHLVPERVMARMLASITDAEQPYAAHLVPPLLGELSRAELEDPEIGPHAAAVVAAWRETLSALQPRGAAVADEILPVDGWQRAIDPDDWPVAGADASPAPVGAGPAWRAWDVSARRALASLPDVMTSDERLAFLLGLWSGGAHAIRTPKAWAAAADWIDAAEGRRVRERADLAAARAWTLASDGPVLAASGEDRQAVDRFVAWAYARAATWPTFSSPDPEIRRYVQDRQVAPADGDDATDDPIDTTDDGGNSERRWPAWLRTAVESRRVPRDRPVRVVRRDTASSVESVLAELDQLEGLDDVKQLFSTLIAQVGLVRKRREQGHDEPLPELHLVLMGNPGTGKTTVARLYGQLLRALGLLETGRFVERVRADLVSPFKGGDSKKARAAVEAADGGILFIDEAYALTQNHQGAGDDPGKEIIAEFVAQMESRRDRFALVLAGYPGPMQNLLTSNPGLESRMRTPVLLPDLSNSALMRVLDGTVEAQGYSYGPGARDALAERIAALPRGERFGNAREIRRLLDVVRGNLARRYHAAPSEVDTNVLTVDDVPTTRPGKRDDEAYAAAMSRVDALVGLAPVKEELRGIAAQVELAARGGGAAASRTVVGHMVFTGNPGTGKTTVAAEVGAILASLGVLRSGHVHTVTHADLIAQYLGQTAPKVRSQVQQALDGVLFIDEAYSLIPRTAGEWKNYEQEALATLVDEMERHRDRLVVVLAGYPKEMEALLDANAGLRSRISRTISFPDFDRSELRAIANMMASGVGPEITEAALDAIADTAAAEAGRPGFGNARTVRETLADAQKRHALRVTGPDAPADGPVGPIELEDVRQPEAPRKNPLGFT